MIKCQPTIVGILMFISRINFMLRVEQEKSCKTLGPGVIFYGNRFPLFKFSCEYRGEKLCL